MYRVNRHAGLVIADHSRPVRPERGLAKTGADSADAPAEEPKFMGFEVRVLAAAALLGGFAFMMFSHDPLPMPKRRRKFRAPEFEPDTGRSTGFVRRSLEEEDADMERAEAMIDEEFEYADDGDMTEDDLDEDDEDEDEEDE